MCVLSWMVLIYRMCLDHYVARNICSNRNFEWTIEKIRCGFHNTLTSLMSHHSNTFSCEIIDREITWTIVTMRLCPSTAFNEFKWPRFPDSEGQKHLRFGAFSSTITGFNHNLWTMCGEVIAYSVLKESHQVWALGHFNKSDRFRIRELLNWI